MNENKKIKKLIEELKEMVLDAHRSAGNLDRLIQCIEMEMESENISCEGYLNVFIKAQAHYRRDYKKAIDYAGFDEREERIWQKLIETLKIES